MDSKTIFSHSKFLTKLAGWLEMMLSSGLSSNALEQSISDLRFRQRLVSFWNEGAIGTKYGQAQEIMGINFFGIDEAVKHFKINLTYQDYMVLAHVPFLVSRLEELADSHILVAMMPISIKQMKEQYREYFAQQIDNHDLKPFMFGVGSVGWRLIPRAVIKDTAKEGQLLTADEAVYALLLQLLTKQKPLFDNFNGVRVKEFSDFEENEVFVSYKNNQITISEHRLPDVVTRKELRARALAQAEDY